MMSADFFPATKWKYCGQILLLISGGQVARDAGQLRMLVCQEV
jgi:hypothetical protein